MREQQVLVAENPGDQDLFGVSVGVKDRTIAVGAVGRGTVFLYERGETAWSLHSSVEPPNLLWFGEAVDLDVDRLLVMARLGRSAHAYARRTHEWSQFAEVRPLNPGSNDGFGLTGRISGNRIVAGAPGEDSSATGINGDGDNNDALDSGAAYVFDLEPPKLDHLYQMRSVASGELLGIDPDTKLLTAPAPSRSRRFRLVDPVGDFVRIQSKRSGEFLWESRVDKLVSVRQGDEGQDRFSVLMSEIGGVKIRGLGSDRGWKFDDYSAGVSADFPAAAYGNQFYLESIQFEDIASDGMLTEAAALALAYQITDGCSAEPLRFCPNAVASRGQMAVFIIRALLGGDDFVFVAEPFFDDVPASHPFYRWIQKMRELGITGGCGERLYCPGNPVTRGQMAVFLIRARYGASTEFPFESAAVFADVDGSHPFFAWIQRLVADGVTQGCAAEPFRYCPGNFVTRGQMAVFVLRALVQELLADGVAKVVSVSPRELGVGATATLTVVVEGLDLTSGTPSLLLGEGLSTGAVSVVDGATLRVDVTAEAGVAVGPRALGVVLAEAVAVDAKGILLD